MTAKEFKVKNSWSNHLLVDSHQCICCKYSIEVFEHYNNHETLKVEPNVTFDSSLKCMACGTKFRTWTFFGCSHWEARQGPGEALLDSRRVQEEIQLCLEY